jgi:signal transduction histidine kinase
MTVPRLTNPTATLDAVLSGGGEMGALMRTVDWARTPVGPVTTWPQSLRTALSILLESRFPMYVAWGPAFTQFYNDGYRPILGSTKHPMAMGRGTRETFAEIWHIIGPMFEGVMLGQAVGLDDFMLPLDRHGFSEECYFSLSYSPIRDESGGVGGVLVTVTETTERVYGERRLRMLRTLGERTTDAKTDVEACRRAAEVLEQNGADLPFARIYLLREEAADGLPGTAPSAANPGTTGQVATLVGSAGALPSTLARGAAPSRIELDRYDGGWPIVEVIRGRGTEVVTDLGARFPRTATATRDAADGEDTPPPHSAIVLPIARPGDPRPAGALIVGISARQRLDRKYRDFLELVASQVATAVASARAYEEERRRAEALAEIDRTKTAFFSNVSHEFRTPLTLMLGPIEDALGEAERLPPEDLERWQMVHRNGLRLGKLVNTLLDFSRIEAGRLQAAYEPTDLASLTIDLASSFRSAVERAGLRLVVDAPTLAAPAHVDRDMWEKIVLNLLSNALKFTFTGEIAVRLRGDAAAFTLTVEDTGVGIAATELPRLFERFHRIKGTRARTHEGTGIGLALVQELVRLHGGTVEATSTVGVGTTFTVRIPTGSAHLPSDRLGVARPLPPTELGASPFVEEALKWAPSPALDAERDGDPGAAGGAGTPGVQARILLADDNADMRQYVARILGASWQVEAVADGSQALRAIRRARPDLVLSDVMMPNLDGFGLVRALRAERETADLPIILLSARAGEDATAEGLRAGANDYLVKPFASRELVARVAAQLERSRTRKLVSAGIEAERRRLRSFLMEAPASIAVLRGRELVFELANDRFTQMVGGRTLSGRRFREAFPELESQGTADLLESIFRTGEPFTASEFPAHLVRSVGGALEEGFYNWVGQPTRSGRGDLPENRGAGDGGGGGDGERDGEGEGGGGHADASRHGPVDGILLFAVDVTDQVRARREIEHTQQREHELRRSAEEATRAKDEFLAMLGHELRNPLAPIVTALHLMRLRGSDETEKERAIIERQVQHVTQLVDDLLDISRITRGKVELKRVPVELAKVVAQAIEMASPLLEQRRHRLTIAVPRHGLTVNADPVRLAQVVANLLTNAAKYTPVGGHITLTASADDAGGASDRPVVVEVADDGIGITAEMLPRVFDLFAQERQAADRSQGGLGLGLAIVHSLVTMHGGSVEARSAGPGQGSRFIVRLPAAGDAATAGGGGGESSVRGRDARRAASAAGASAPTAGPAERRILVVDDNEDAADMMAEFLTGLGFSVRVAHDGPSGLREAEEFLPEIALLDIGLPAMDGYELARRLRVMPALRRLKMIAVTGYGQETDRARAHEAGFDRHIVKPVDALKLEAMLDGLVEA